MDATVVADWQLTDPAGSTTAADSSGYGNTATLDSTYSNVQFGVADPEYGSVAAFDMGLLLAPSTPQLDPGNRNLVVTVRIKTNYAPGSSNFFQKGTTRPGQPFWKIEMVKGNRVPGTPRCRFAGDAGSALVLGTTTVNDDVWHTITCRKTASTISITVDGVREATRDVVIGSIGGDAPVAIGMKYLPSGAPVDPHDALHGEMSLARIAIGP